MRIGSRNIAKAITPPWVSVVLPVVHHLTHGELSRDGEAGSTGGETLLLHAGALQVLADTLQQVVERVPRLLGGDAVSHGDDEVGVVGSTVPFNASDTRNGAGDVAERLEGVRGQVVLRTNQPRVGLSRLLAVSDDVDVAEIKTGEGAHSHSSGWGVSM